MLYRPFGSTELTLSALGFGCGSIGGLMVRNVSGYAHDGGAPSSWA
ncbi:MAG: hypothetical protein R3A44_28500 [Caldilineaceae bacterium]